MRPFHFVNPFKRLRTRLLWGLLGVGVLAGVAPATQADDMLSPEQAFHASAQVDGQTVQLNFSVATGYHLYRDRIVITPQNPAVSLGKPVFPEGEIDNDPYFGKLVVYKKDFSLPVPILSSPAGETTLKVKYQGCSDVAGVCYPPQTQTLNVTLPAVTAAGSSPTTPPAAKPMASLSSLAGLGGSGAGGDEPLPPEEAFKPSIQVHGDQVALHWDIAPGYHLYRDRIKVALTDSDAKIQSATLDQGILDHDPTLGDVFIFHTQANAELTLKPGQKGSAVLIAGYQGCAEQGLCYPPQTQAWTIDFKSGSAQALDSAPKATLTPVVELLNPQAKPAIAASHTPEASQPAAATTGQLSATDAITQKLKTGSLWTIIVGFFLLGLLLAFTPCIFPMIPILAGIIAGQGEKITPRKALLLSVVYVLAMAVTYTIAGVLAGLFGSNLQAAFQNPWILSAFAAVFVALALSMFGFFELQLPSALQSKIMQVQNNQQGGTLIGVAVMGLLSALIVGPCMAPPLAGALIYIGQTGDALLGGTALFAMSLGMGLPLIIVGTLGGKFLPRAGGWMDAVKAVFGVIMLGVAIWMLERIVPDVVAQLLWGMLLIASAVFLGALTTLDGNASGWRKLWKSLGVLLLLWGSLILVGVAAGGKGSVLAPLSGLSLGGGSSSASTGVSFTRIKNLAELDQQLAAAKAAGKPVMLDFYADWCVECKKMEHDTFSDPGIVAALKPFVLLQADVTANNADDKALFKRFEVLGPPTIVFFNAQGVEQKAQQVVGYEAPDRFLRHLEAVH
ncbi:protein-disulfide reductase DsbD [Halothiobacillus sp. DCM-1]|uniref:protein-disulfide reductase DsbD n=1 Tax=Halothiobacillus sp. DCM-1 TaxID=3112558 RepID=UPI0032555CEB